MALLKITRKSSEHFSYRPGNYLKIAFPWSDRLRYVDNQKITHGHRVSLLASQYQYKELLMSVNLKNIYPLH